MEKSLDHNKGTTGEKRNLLLLFVSQQNYYTFNSAREHNQVYKLQNPTVTSNSVIDYIQLLFLW